MLRSVESTAYPVLLFNKRMNIRRSFRLRLDFYVDSIVIFFNLVMQGHTLVSLAEELPELYTDAMPVLRIPLASNIPTFAEDVLVFVFSQEVYYFSRVIYIRHFCVPLFCSWVVTCDGLRAKPPQVEFSNLLLVRFL